MVKRHYFMALVCYLAIPAVVMAGGFLSQLIDPEWAQGSADYPRNFHLLQMAAMGLLMAAGGAAVVLWLATCHLVLEARQRSGWWLVLAIAGPLGFMVIAMLADRSPAPGDRYEHVVSKLKWYSRAPLEIALFVAVWVVAFLCVDFKRELLIRLESLRTGTSVQTIVALQNASSGMHAFSQGLETLYLVSLFYLLWPIFFNLVGRYFSRPANPLP